MAWAQQSGLFPLHPIKRHRVPCDREDPIYKINKYQYFGYHPTCWHRFPDGWGCPSAEAPDREKSFRETPLGSGSEGDLNPPGEEGRDMENAPTRPRGTLPAVPPGGQSPFDTNPATPGGTPNPRRNVPQDDPFATPNPDARNPQGQPAPANPPAGNAPDLSSPFDQPKEKASPRASRDTGAESAFGEDADGPVLALPNINLPPLANASSVYEPPASAPANPANNPVAAMPGAAPRRGLVSGFFNNLGVNWIRR
jgi:hypothetical protein